MLHPSSDKNHKKFWSFIKSRKNDNVGISPLRSSNGIVYSDSKAKAEILNSQFVSVFNKDTDSRLPDLNFQYSEMANFTIHTNGIEKLLKGLSDHKASGPDKISNRLLKLLAEEVSPILQILFEATLKQGYLPKEWRHALVSPIFKKGDNGKAANYRPVSLTSVVCKTMEHIVASQIMRHLQDHNILTDAQHGFRKRISCESQLIMLVQDLALNIEEKHQTNMILLDFSKAFDKVPHQRLLHKLKSFGISQQATGWIAGFLFDRTQQVLVEGIASNPSPVTSGVPQGSVLGPLLFLLFINDLPSYIKNSSDIRLFADDCVIYRRIASQQDALALQEDLNSLLDWEQQWGMEFHPQKCQVLRVSLKKNEIAANYNIREHTLERVNDAKYLGVILNEKLSWNSHIDNISKKGHNTLNFLQRNIVNCPQNIKSLSYSTLVRPQLEYCAAVWDPHTKRNTDKLESVQRKAARFVTYDFCRRSSVSAMLTTLEWKTLEERRRHIKLTLLFKIVNNLVDIKPTMLNQSTAHLGEHHRYIVPYARTLLYKHSFFPSAIRAWNSLKVEETSVGTPEAFRAMF